MDEADYEALTKIKKKDLQAWHNRIYRPENATLVLVGKVDPAQAEAYINTYFADWKSKSEDAPIPAPPGVSTLPERQIIVFDSENDTQTQVTLYCPLTPASFDTLATGQVLGGTLSELAWVALRETSGVSYGASAAARSMPGGANYLTMSSLVQNNAVALATTTFLDIAGKATQGNIDPDLVTVTKAQIARGYTLGQQTSRGMMSRFLSPLSMGSDWMSLVTYPSSLAAITVEDLKSLASPCAGHEIVSLKGPKSVITPQLDKAELTYEVFDWKAEADKLWMAYDPKGFEEEKERKAKLKDKEDKMKKEGGKEK